MNNKTTIKKINNQYLNKILDKVADAKLNVEDLDVLFKEWKAKLDNIKDVDL